MKKVQAKNSQNANILCKQKEMNQVPQSEIHIRIINQGLLRNIVNTRVDHQDLGTKFFSMVTVIIALTLVTKLQAFDFRKMQSRNNQRLQHRTRK